MNIGYYKSILIITIISYIIFIILNTPYGTVEQYKDTEYYTESIPYTDMEYYTESVPYTDTESYTENEPYDVVLYSGTLFGKSIYNFNNAIKVDREYVGKNVYNYAICWDNKCEIYNNIRNANIQSNKIIRYRDVQKSRQVTKYRDVQKSRQVTKYRDVQKSRQVTKYREIVLSLVQRMNIILDKM